MRKVGSSGMFVLAVRRLDYESRQSDLSLRASPRLPLTAFQIEQGKINLFLNGVITLKVLIYLF